MVDVGTGRPIWALGFMSGTSMDGVDAAAILTDGETVSQFGPSAFEPFDAGLRALLTRLMQRAAVEYPFPDDDSEVQQAIEALHRRHASVLRAFGGEPRVEAVGMHGQTLFHAPADGVTVQIGDGTRLCREAGAPVVSDFRSADVAAGGEGAPLVPFFHFALARHIGATEPLAFLNIGGVANLTWVDPTKAAPSREGACLAFDTGPGNALVNDWMMAQTGAEMDAGGAAAAEGTIHAGRLRTNAGAAYLDRAPPKSLDRNDFATVLAGMEGLSVADGAATLTAFSADCIAASVTHMPSPPSRWLVHGGGRKNATMMGMIAERLGVPVEPVEAVGLDGDMLEAQAFAYLAVRVLRGLPTSAPGTTGCREPVSGGCISRP